MARVSIICGAYNLESCYSFHASIKSILDQTFTDIELIICDDGSTDNTWSILQDYASQDDRIKLIQNAINQGLAYSLNRCIELCTGEYIARHDLDDYSHKDRIAKQVQYLDSHGDVDILGTNTYLFDINGVWGKQEFPETVENENFLFTSPYKHGSVMFRASVLKAENYRVSKETRRTEDYDLFMTLQTRYTGKNLQEYLYYFCEDEKAKKRRKYRYRIDEMKVRFRGFKKLGLMPKGFIYAIKPLFVGLIPGFILTRLQNKHYKRKLREENGDKR